MSQDDENGTGRWLLLWSLVWATIIALLFIASQARAQTWQRKVGNVHGGMFSTFCLTPPNWTQDCDPAVCSPLSRDEKKRWTGRYCDIVDSGPRAYSEGIQAEYLVDAPTYNPTITGSMHGNPISMGIRTKWEWTVGGTCFNDSTVSCDAYTDIGKNACNALGGCDLDYFFDLYTSYYDQYLRDKNDMPVIAFIHGRYVNCNYQAFGCCTAGSRAGLGCGWDAECPGGTCGGCTRVDDKGTSRPFSHNQSNLFCDFLVDPGKMAELWYADFVIDHMVRNQDDGGLWNNQTSTHFALTDNTPANIDWPNVTTGSDYLPSANAWVCDGTQDSCSTDADCTAGGCDNFWHYPAYLYIDTDGDGQVNRRKTLTEFRADWAEWFHRMTTAVHNRGAYVASVGQTGVPNPPTQGSRPTWRDTAMMYLAGSTWCSETDQICATNSPAGYTSTLEVTPTCPGSETCSRSYIGGDGFMLEYGLPVCTFSRYIPGDVLGENQITGANAQAALAYWWDLMHLPGEKHALPLSCLARSGQSWSVGALGPNTNKYMAAWFYMIWESKNYALWSGGWDGFMSASICEPCVAAGNPYPSCLGKWSGDRNCNDDGSCCLYDAYPFLTLHMGCPIVRTGGTTKYEDDAGLMLREFQGGFVAMNMTSSSRSFSLPGRCSNNWIQKCTTDDECGGFCATDRWRTFANPGPLSVSQSLSAGRAEIYFDDNETYQCASEIAGVEDLIIITDVDGLGRSDAQDLAAARIAAAD